MNNRCFKAKPEGWEPNKFSQIEFGKIIFGKWLPNLLFKWQVKATVLVLTATIVGVAGYGVSQMEANQDEILYMDQNSYQVRFYSALKKYFPMDGEKVEIYVGDIPLWRYPDQLLKIQAVIEENPFVSNGSFSFWFQGFNQYCVDNRINCFQGDLSFKTGLLRFLANPDNLFYLDSFRFRPDLTKMNMSEIINYLQNNITDLEITATRATFQHIIMDNSSVQDEAMNSILDGMKEIRFEGQEFESPKVYNNMYIHWQANLVSVSSFVS